jgi:hypothetical protein
MRFEVKNSGCEVWDQEFEGFEEWGKGKGFRV